MMNKHHRELTKRLEAEGVDVVGWSETSKHAVCHFLDAGGLVRRYFTGRTPSDHRVAIRVTRDIVRMARVAKP